MERGSLETRLILDVCYGESVFGATPTSGQFTLQSVEGKPVDCWIGRKAGKLWSRRLCEAFVASLEEPRIPTVEGQVELLLLRAECICRRNKEGSARSQDSGELVQAPLPFHHVL